MLGNEVLGAFGPCRQLHSIHRFAILPRSQRQSLVVYQKAAAMVSSFHAKGRPQTAPTASELHLMTLKRLNATKSRYEYKSMASSVICSLQSIAVSTEMLCLAAPWQRCSCMSCFLLVCRPARNRTYLDTSASPDSCSRRLMTVILNALGNEMM